MLNKFAQDLQKWLDGMNKYDSSDRIRGLQWGELETEFDHVCYELERVTSLEGCEPSAVELKLLSHLLIENMTVIMMRFLLIQMTAPLFADKVDSLVQMYGRFKELPKDVDHPLCVRWPLKLEEDVFLDDSKELIDVEHEDEGTKLEIHLNQLLYNPHFFYHKSCDVNPFLIRERVIHGINSNIPTPEGAGLLMDGGYYEGIENILQELTVEIVMALEEVIRNVGSFSFADEVSEFCRSKIFREKTLGYQQYLDKEKDEFQRLLRRNQAFAPFIESYEDACIRNDLDSYGRGVARKSFDDWVNLLSVAALLQSYEERRSAPLSDALICKAIVAALSVDGAADSAKWAGIYFAWKKEPRLPQINNTEDFINLMNSPRFKDARTKKLKETARKKGKEYYKLTKNMDLRRYSSNQYLNDNSPEDWTQNGWNRVDTPKINWKGVEVAQHAAMKFKETLDGGVDSAT